VEGSFSERVSRRSRGIDVRYHVYIPDVYESKTGQRLPLVYWLHGTGGSGPGLTRLAARLDAAIRAGEGAAHAGRVSEWPLLRHVCRLEERPGADGDVLDKGWSRTSTRP
jgi:hypothetical protein